MNKLYALFSVKDDQSHHQLVAASNDMDKLIRITPSNTIHIVNDPNDKTLRMVTPEGVYPMYTIREIPYVC